MILIFSYILNITIYQNIIFKFILSLFIISVSFYSKNTREFLKLISIFYLITFVIGGASFGLAYLLNIKKRLSKRRLINLLCCIVFCLLIMFFFSGKSRVDIKAMTVSPNEQYIAFFETGNGHKIQCFHSDGSLMFKLDVLPEISGGGHCTLWFENDILCVLFYRPDKIAYFALDGTLLEIVDNENEEWPPEFPSFNYKGRQYLFDGKEIDVVYNKRRFLDYWLFGAERYLDIVPRNGESRRVYTWSTKG